jgi:hypothetical protein
MEWAERWMDVRDRLRNVHGPTSCELWFDPVLCFVTKTEGIESALFFCPIDSTVSYTRQVYAVGTADVGDGPVCPVRPAALFPPPCRPPLPPPLPVRSPVLPSVPDPVDPVSIELARRVVRSRIVFEIRFPSVSLSCKGSEDEKRTFVLSMTA